MVVTSYIICNLHRNVAIVKYSVIRTWSVGSHSIPFALLYFPWEFRIQELEYVMGYLWHVRFRNTERNRSETEYNNKI